MKLINNLLLIIVAVSLTISGCAESSALIRKSSASIRNDIFQELANGGQVPAGYADLRITSSLKTHKPGIYSANDIHGTPDYKLLLNIGGQAIQLQGKLREENSESQGLRDPEAGDGVRYEFTSNLRLKAGTYKVVIAVPADDIAMEQEITLREGSNNLVLEPVYRATLGKRRLGFYGSTSFTEGIKWFRAVLNGQPL
ncbi:hypothetical protein [Geobacter sp. DSM 9736]|uniref:hypothetical protein n=1 Tax=Geobacter sp. DSM 9736 TaxID=1277350 RepID=UPI000B5EA13E|nr:hypothetical protein [Geobacter sp. DSM 9736]SNB45524.1 hypothetical protein SAMN06269301_0942 [Geobacter sp. DSM 9736]